MEKQTVCAVILAAGKSTRMGKTKQLLPLYENESMLELVINKVVDQVFDQVLVIIGHDAKEIQKRIGTRDDCQFITNDQYSLGQSTSFRKAFIHMSPSTDAAMFFLADQPYIKNSTIREVLKRGVMRQLCEPNPFVIQAYYQNEPGHPVYFGNVNEIDFSSLTGDEGGKGLFKQLNKEQLPLNDSGIIFDIDTPQDYQKALLNLKNKS
ncbi:nucleotidyltransferase family protein [Halalkalibacter akibai]|uniref:CTP:molybdopterin cytidylyltransferase n=1 Tax=Halalkalibacter akibai (strain ATCC 43226 / DSM 21942 / CIP 109018 / JCM 9157 / 1139) TaxID=1236973 RepID=W4QYR1_HALA3|nr:nucleotidyltransferase family protein [Halalkalibacter akibai]GAE37037.1 CTP:molybdopterin cytidylyltransferase [Halalkalibacter akibai JCM 9157]